MKSVGLEYLTLSRKAGSLSGGEAQRIRLATQIGSALVGVLYILDEPMGGVDPATRSSILDFIMQNYAQKSTLLISTHLINDLESVFTHALFIGGGKVLLNDSVAEITKDGKHIEDVFKEVFSNVW